MYGPILVVTLTVTKVSHRVKYAIEKKGKQKKLLSHYIPRNLRLLQTIIVWYYNEYLLC